ncbi:MAG: transcriptional repressor, partial [Chloroflexi bacterium]|nr:transcriptional repressor [Chloroflexota bacterium]
MVSGRRKDRPCASGSFRFARRPDLGPADRWHGCARAHRCAGGPARQPELVSGWESPAVRPLLPRNISASIQPAVDRRPLGRGDRPQAVRLQPQVALALLEGMDHLDSLPFWLILIGNDYQYQESCMTAELWLSELQENGYRLTEARRAVVELIASAQRALSPLEVYDLARAQHPGLGLVSVYRTLEKLEELHLIQRVHQPRGCQAFIAASRGHAHLF